MWRLHGRSSDPTSVALAACIAFAACGRDADNDADAPVRARPDADSTALSPPDADNCASDADRAPPPVGGYPPQRRRHLEWMSIGPPLGYAEGVVRVAADAHLQLVVISTNSGGQEEWNGDFRGWIPQLDRADIRRDGDTFFVELYERLVPCAGSCGALAEEEATVYSIPRLPPGLYTVVAPAIPIPADWQWEPWSQEPIVLSFEVVANSP